MTVFTLSTPVMAQPSVVSGVPNVMDLTALPESERVKILGMLAEAKKAKEAGVVEKVAAATPEKLEMYAGVGVQIGKAIAATAKELGFEVNEFAKTTIGKLTVAMIIWKLVGAKFFGVILGVGFLTVFLFIWMHIYNRRLLKIVKSDVTTEEPNAEGKIVKTRKIHYDNSIGSTDERAWFHAFMGALLFIVLLFSKVVFF
jgi:hypothetical protein